MGDATKAGTVVIEAVDPADAPLELLLDAGARRLELGTGSFGHQLAFYQRAGFRVTAVDRDFFLRNYPEPIYEDGIQHRDMLRLALEFGQPAEPPAP